MNKQLLHRLVLAIVLVCLVVAAWFQWRRWRERQAELADWDRLTSTAKQSRSISITRR